jgi:hypothetical protein
MSLQDELNRLAGTTDRTCRDCLNILAAVTDMNETSQNCANILASTTGLRTQDALNAWAETSGLSKQDAVKTIEEIPD